MMSPFKFKKYGDSGLQISELWPNVGGIADDICMINSMYSEIPNHEPCITMMNTGSNIIGRPSMGAWITYGLGLENQNLPGYVVLCPSQPITIGSPLWSAGFLPAMHQGTYVKNEWIEGEPFEAAKVIPNVTNSAVSDAVQKRNVGFLRKLNELNMEAVGQARTRNWTPPLNPWRPRIGCRPRRPRCSTSARKARRRSICTGREAPRWAA